MSHHNQVHKFIPIPSDEKSGCKSSSGQGMEEARNNFSVAAEKKSKAERRLFWRHRERQRKVHFATLVDTCHLKNAELEPPFQKYKGRVVLRGDIVKDFSGAIAVFTE